MFLLVRPKDQGSQGKIEQMLNQLVHANRATSTEMLTHDIVLDLRPLSSIAGPVDAPLK